MIYLALFVLGFTFIRLLVVVSNYGQWLHSAQPKSKPLVSVLIPARNEEFNIGTILHHLSTHDYENMEILVYDDLSSDRTYEVASEIAARDSRIKVIRGSELPEGWMGKNNGCHRLAMEAEGEYLLFLDADVKVYKGLIASAVANVQKNQTDLFSIFPKQKMNTLAEWLTVPLMNWILVSLLPLRLVKGSKWSSFSAANGQFMMFRAEVYQKEKFHQQLKGINVEDIAISRLMKQKGYRVQTLLGNHQMSCRMYQAWEEAVHGFSRNLFYFFGGSKVLSLLFALLTTFGFVAVYLALGWQGAAAYFIMTILIRILVSLWSRQNIAINLLLGPLQQFSLFYVIVKALVLRYRGATQWKGRIIDKIA
jgi:glycosyltransferase involved in cell wall biosynthesis